MRPYDKIQFRQPFEKLNTHPSFFIISNLSVTSSPLETSWLTKKMFLYFQIQKVYHKVAKRL